MTDKYRPSREIIVRQPAIVLLNPQCAGSLLISPTTEFEKQEATYWKERAFVYVMGTMRQAIDELLSNRFHSVSS